jgi:hypothetical protein
MEPYALLVYPGAVTWKAWLEGHEFDFEDLTRLFGSGDIVVARDDEGCYIASIEIDNDVERERRYEKAQRLLDLVNGAAKTDNPDFTPVKLSGSLQSGDRRHVFASTDIRWRVQAPASGLVTDPDRQVRNNPPPGPARVITAMKYPAAAEALQIMAKPAPTNWVDLYKVYEIIKDSGALPSVARSIGVSDRDLALFRRSANHPDASGSDARHARSNEQPPKCPMSVGDGRIFIGRLLTAWLDSLQ